jgi:hypothetical protein
MTTNLPNNIEGQIRDTTMFFEDGILKRASI